MAENKMRYPKDFAKVLFVVSLAGGIFSYGFIAAVYQLFPYSIIKGAVDSVKLVVSEAGMVTGLKPTKHLFPAPYPGSGVVYHDTERIAEGVVLLSSFFDDGPQIRLITEDGSLVHRWPISVSEIWPDFDHVAKDERPNTDWNVLLDGVALLPDGSVAFAMFGLVRMDWCGRVMWKVSRNVHHAVQTTSNGGFWVPAKHYVNGESLHPPLKPPYDVDTILEVSDAGEIIREIDVLDLFWKSDMLGVLFANNRGFDPHPERRDVAHLNDVEEIPVAWVDKFPQFEQRDILISLREANMLMVVDPDEEEVKWFQTGPWIQQHDGDWQPDGTITVFDNNYDRSNDGRYFGGSRVMSVDPQTREVKYLYGDKPEHRMYTKTQGDQQVLSNGNILITESNAGRVIEVTTAGDVVWEYINRYSDEEVARITDATKYSRSYFEDLERRCE